MEIKVGIQHVNREIIVDSTETADDIEKAFAKRDDRRAVFSA